MTTSHYAGLYGAYAAAVVGWWIVSRTVARVGWAPSTWMGSTVYEFPRPWRELLFALLGVVGVLLVGQLWSQGWMLPASGAVAPLIEALNQILIFLPIVLVPIVRRQGSRTALLPKDHIVVRLLVGLVLAFLALSVYSLVRSGSHGALGMVARILHFENLDEVVQVLMEDIAIGIVAYRLAARVGSKWTVVAVAALFALGHVPALVSGGASLAQLGGLVFDFGLGLMLAGTILRSGDILWFWPIHAAMDLTQFTRISGL